MRFGNCKINTHVQVMMDNVNIERVYENKFLGVILDHEICWIPHIKYVRAKLARSIAVLGKTRHILDHKVLYTLYCSLILPYLNYCVEVWGNTYKSTIRSLCILQKKAMRIINDVGFCEHINMLFLKSHALKFMDLIEFKTAQIMYKARNNLLPGNIKKCSQTERGFIRGKFNLKKHCLYYCEVFVHFNFWGEFVEWSRC